MRLLLDSHTFFVVLRRERLSKPARAAIEDPKNEKYVSHATAWEIAIKAHAFPAGATRAPAHHRDYKHTHTPGLGAVKVPLQHRC